MLVRALVVIAITAVLLEFSSFIYLSQFAERANKPSYTLGNTALDYFVYTKDMGRWHRPNAAYEKKGIQFQTNTHGAADRERDKQSSQSRAIVLGDSYIEGEGLPFEYRFVTQLEKKTGIPHLNFGVAGTGVTEAVLRYEKLGPQFDHDAVILAILPFNDLLDDRVSSRRQLRGIHLYKPYLVGDYPDYRYDIADIAPPKRFAEAGLVTKVKAVLSNYTNIYNVLGYAKNRLLHADVAASRTKTLKDENRLSYFDYAQDDLDRLRFNIERLVRLANGKPVLIMLIADPADFQRRRAGGVPKLSNDVREISESAGADFYDFLTDEQLSNADEETIQGLYRDHWSKAGSLFAVDRVVSSFSFYQK